MIGGSVGLAFGGKGGPGGDAMGVTVTNNATGTGITTTGMHADGIVAQSIGGGGGNGGFSVAGGISGSDSGSRSVSAARASRRCRQYGERRYDIDYPHHGRRIRRGRSRNRSAAAAAMAASRSRAVFE